MAKLVPNDKQSKQKQRDTFTSQRKDLGGLNPVSRKPPNPKAYVHKKTGQR